MAYLSPSLLGSFQATLGKDPVAGFESNNVRALLAYLAVEAHRRPGEHPRQALAERLWPDKPERAALSNLPPQVVARARSRGRARDLWAMAEELLAE